VIEKPEAQASKFKSNSKSITAVLKQFVWIEMQGLAVLADAEQPQA
jgi:hypothetical protein